MFVKCFDAVEMVTDEATKRFAPMFREDPEAKDILREYCDALDSMTPDFDTESFEVEVDEIKMTIAIRMECGEIVVTNQEHVLYKLMQRALSVKFYHGDGDTIVAELVFPSIWERAV